MKAKIIAILSFLLVCSSSFSLKEAKSHFVGEIYGGGIVFFVEKNGNHGLVASLEDVCKNVPWASLPAPAIPFPTFGKYPRGPRTFSSDIDGLYNTKMIIKTGYENSAAFHCSNYSSNTFHDWYLPALDELKALMNSKILINQILGDSTNNFEPLSDSYWSSTNTELYSNGTWAYKSRFELVNMFTNRLNVRAVRKF